MALLETLSDKALSSLIPRCKEVEHQEDLEVGLKLIRILSAHASSDDRRFRKQSGIVAISITKGEDFFYALNTLRKMEGDDSILEDIILKMRALDKKTFSIITEKIREIVINKLEQHRSESNVKKVQEGTTNDTFRAMTGRDKGIEMGQ